MLPRVNFAYKYVFRGLNLPSTCLRHVYGHFIFRPLEVLGDQDPKILEAILSIMNV